MIELTKIEYNAYVALSFIIGACFSLSLLFMIGVIKFTFKKKQNEADN